MEREVRLGEIARLGRQELHRDRLDEGGIDGTKLGSERLGDGRQAAPPLLLDRTAVVLGRAVLMPEAGRRDRLRESRPDLGRRSKVQNRRLLVEALVKSVGVRDKIDVEEEVRVGRSFVDTSEADSDKAAKGRSADQCQTRKGRAGTRSKLPNLSRIAFWKPKPSRTVGAVPFAF